MTIRRPKAIHYTLLLCLFLYLLPYFFGSRITVCDELDYHYFSTLLSKKGILTFKSEADSFFGFRGFIPQHFVYNERGEVVPQGPPGFILLASFFKIFLPDDLVFFLINPVLGIVSILLMFQITKTLWKEQDRAFYCSVLLATTPVFVHWTNLFYPDMFHLTIFLAALWCLAQMVTKQRLSYYMFFGMFLGGTLWTRYSSVIFLLPMAILILLNKNKIKCKKLALSLTTFSLMICCLLIYNFKIYGNFFRVGYICNPKEIKLKHEGENQGVDKASESKQSLLTDSKESLIKLISWQRFHPQVISDQIKSAPFSLSLAFPPFILALLGLYHGLKTKGNRGLYIFLLVFFVTIFIYFANVPTRGHKEELTLHSSFLRYLLPLFALSAIPAINLLCNLKNSFKRIMISLICVNLMVACFANLGVVYTIFNKVFLEDIRNFILVNTAKKTVIISSYWDKVIFPQRIVYSWSQHLENRQLAELTKNILQKGYSVCYPFSERDPEVADMLNSLYPVKKVEGPKKLHPLFGLLPYPLPSHVYPVTLFIVKAPLVNSIL